MPRLLKLSLTLVTLAALGLTVVSSAAAQGSWTTVAPMPVHRFDLAVVAGPDNRIYAIGGNYTTDYRPINHVEAYDHVTDNWTAVAPMRTARGGPAAAVGLNGLIYVFGGHDRAINSLNTVEAYDPATDTWTAKASMPTARAFAAAATGSDGRIYVIGGAPSGGVGLDTVEAYDPNTDTWTTVASMPTARYVLAAVRLSADNNRIYAIGGATSGGSPLNTVEAYDPATDTWSTITPMSTSRYNPAAAVGPNGRLYVIGGYDTGVLDSVEVFDLSTGWSTAAPMPTARYDLGAATGADGRIYAIGGYDDVRPISNTVEAYTP